MRKDEPEAKVGGKVQQSHDMPDISHILVTQIGGYMRWARPLLR